MAGLAMDNLRRPRYLGATRTEHAQTGVPRLDALQYVAGEDYDADNYDAGFCYRVCAYGIAASASSERLLA